MENNIKPIIVEETYSASIQKVWSAITEVEQMRKWSFAMLQDFKAEVGFETQFVVVNEGRTFTHCWKVLEVIPYKKIVTQWYFSEYDGDGHVTYDLFEEGDKTKVRLTSVVTKAYPDDIPEFKRESGVGGWNYFIKQQLKNYLEKE